jgi:hypothetical protein
MWAFLTLPGGGKGLEEWESGEPALVVAGLGWEFPKDFEELVLARGVNRDEFRSVLMHTTEVLYGSLYAAADHEGSMHDLEGLSRLALVAGAAWPELSVFASSRWFGDGWGLPITADQLSKWRAAAIEPPL